MAPHWTTRCCSAIALTLLAASLTWAEGSRKISDVPLGLFPVVPIWNLALESVVPAPPVLKGDRGYFPIGGDRLAAYDIAYGTLLWLTTARPRFQPALGDGLVFLVEPEGLVALHDDTGAVAWRAPISDELAAPVVWDNEWLIGTTRTGEVLAFRARDGVMIWRKDAGGRIRGSAALAADRVYVPLDDGRIVALQVETGDRVWTRRLGGAPNEILALDDRLFVGSNDNYFYAIGARTGEVLWRWPTGADVVGLPVADRHRVYFVSYDNLLRGLDKHSGAQRWKRPLPLRPTRGPLMAGDLLIVSGIAGKSPAYHVKDGTPAGEVATGGELIVTPHVVPGTAPPQVVLVTREVADNTMVHAMARSAEPPDREIAPLPNPIPPPALPYPDLTFETCVLPESPTEEGSTSETPAAGEEPPPAAKSASPQSVSPDPAGPTGPAGPAPSSRSTAPPKAAGVPTTTPPVNRAVSCIPVPEALGDAVPVDVISLPTPAAPPRP